MKIYVIHGYDETGTKYCAEVVAVYAKKKDAEIAAESLRMNVREVMDYYSRRNREVELNPSSTFMNRLKDWDRLNSEPVHDEKLNSLYEVIELDLKEAP